MNQFVVGLSALSLSALVLDGVVSAQQVKFVSPVQAATVDGAGSNSFPWADTRTRRYMQIHSDVTQVGLVKNLAWRHQANSATSTSTRSFDMEVFMGMSRSWDQARMTFAQNYIAPPMQVLTRQVVNFNGPTSSGSPMPFTMSVPLTNPYPFPGGSMAWEAVIYQVTAGGSWSSVDVDYGSFTTAAAAAVTGTGCVATGQTLAMIHTISVADVGGILNFGALVNRAPASVPAILLLGASNPNLSVPGLCGGVYTDMLFSINLLLTDANGRIATTSGTSLYPTGPGCFAIPNVAPGATLYTQVAALDPGSSSPIGVALSDGRSMLLPSSNTSKVVKASRIFNNDGGTAATDAIWFATSTLGYAMVTEFTF